MSGTENEGSGTPYEAHGILDFRPRRVQPNNSEWTRKMRKHLSGEQLHRAKLFSSPTPGTRSKSPGGQGAPWGRWNVVTVLFPSKLFLFSVPLICEKKATPMATVSDS